MDPPRTPVTDVPRYQRNRVLTTASCVTMALPGGCGSEAVDQPTGTPANARGVDSPRRADGAEQCLTAVCASTSVPAPTSSARTLRRSAWQPSADAQHTER